MAKRVRCYSLRGCNDKVSPRFTMPVKEELREIWDLIWNTMSHRLKKTVLAVLTAIFCSTVYESVKERFNVQQNATTVAGPSSSMEDDVYLAQKPRKVYGNRKIQITRRAAN